MGRTNGNRVAIFLATLIAANMIHSVATGQGLAVPQHGGQPVRLALPDSTSTTARPSELLQVFVGQVDTCCEGRTPIAGRYARTDDTLTFTPAFGFDAGQDYVARVRTSQIEELVAFRIPSQAATVPAIVTQIYPSGDTLPENTLRFYIHFSVPMTPHVAFDYISLRDATGMADEAAFMRFKQELWNEERTRLTVLMDPGRIKRQVATNVALGPALLAGQTYTLDVDSGWPSADGASVLPAFSKAFEVSEALRERPDTSHWTVNAPCAGTREPLKITLGRPFDRHLLTQALRVEFETGNSVDGTIQIGNAERTWNFTPNRPWSSGDLLVVVNPVLEDVAGNNFHDLLDHVADRQEAVASSTDLQVSILSCEE